MLGVQNLVIRGADRTIVGPITFAVRPGQVVALVGESGSGKTSTGLALIDDLPSGLHLDGSLIGDPQRTGYVPQHPGSVLTPSRRVGSILHEVARIRFGKPTGSIVGRAVARANLDPELLRRFSHQLSGGQQQRAVLALALLGDPSAIIADEPTTGQDRQHRDALATELANLRSAGTAILLLSHDLDLVRRLADESVVLRSGRVIEQGPHVWQAPQQAYTKSLIESSELRRPAFVAPSTPPLLRVKSLSAGYRSRRSSTVFSDLEIVLGSGECLAVLGQSGAGKSTLARCLVGLHRPRSGELIMGADHVPWAVQARSRSQRAAMQYVFQDARAAFDPFQSVEAQVVRPSANLHREAPSTALQRLTQLTEKVGLDPDLLRRRVGGLSGGELQRAALLRALMALPKVLICDEITTGLDPVTRDQVLALLEDLLTEGLAIVIISHEPFVANRIASEVLQI